MHANSWLDADYFTMASIFLTLSIVLYQGKDAVRALISRMETHDIVNSMLLSLSLLLGSAYP